MTRTESLWAGTHQLRRFAPLSREIAVDVLVIGSGITGVTAALLLAQGGRDVALIEQDRIGSGETGLTTSHLTEAIDGRYQRIQHDFGRDAAALVAQSSRSAIDRIEQFVRQLAIPCGFERLPGYLYSERESDLDLLAAELDAAQRAGCAVEWVNEVPVPFRTVGGILWHNQAQVHETAYLGGLIEAAVGRGVRIYEETRATNVHDGEPCVVHTNRSDIRARAVFVAANVPVNNRVFLHTKIAAYRSYAEAVPWTAGAMRGLFWDTDDPYHYTRTQDAAGRTYLIVGGEDHRTGKEEDTDACYTRLSDYRRSRFGGEEPRYRWSGQIIEPVDGLPYIGPNTGAAHVYVATGFAGNGMTYGTLAGMIVTDLMLGRDNAYAALYDATRVKPVASAYDFVVENVTFPTRLASDRLTSLDVEARTPEQLRPGQGGIFAGENGKLAISRDSSGVLSACSAVCTHLGCDVAWNAAEQTWDCACHGSRFSPHGRVINGPAVADLEQREIHTSR